VLFNQDRCVKNNNDVFNSYNDTQRDVTRKNYSENKIKIIVIAADL